MSKQLLLAVSFLLLGATSALADRTVYFNQVADYCSNPISYLQGQAMIKNVSTGVVSGSVTIYLEYMSGPSAPQIDTVTKGFTLNAGETTFAQVVNSMAGYGCHGVVRVHGSITITGAVGIVTAAGNILTRETNASSATDYVNIPFPIPSQPF